MDEFVGRMQTQRHILHVVNSKVSRAEELCGLSAGALRRWELAHQLSPSSELMILLRELSSELFFMATRSQEPVSDEYKLHQQNIIRLVGQLESIV